MAFKYSPFTQKQLKLLTWWLPESPYNKENGIIAEGAVRSGKTIIMGLSFIMWAMSEKRFQNYALCGKTVGSTYRNLVDPLVPLLRSRGYKVVEKRNANILLVSKDKRVNRFYIFGGRDESSASLVQGVTLTGVLFDEVALMPQSFVDQALARCSEEGSKFWFNCNPDGPRHWFKTEHVDKYKEKGYLRLHFMLEDNPSLAPDILKRYKSMFTGIFYKRFILGEWAFSDGVVYSNIPDSTYFSDSDIDNIVPIKVRENDIKPYYAADYGTTNPMVFLEIYKVKKPNEPMPYFYVTNEYCWDSKKQFMQKTNDQYVEDFKQFVTVDNYHSLILDPSATSLKVALKYAGVPVINAKNDVLPGISMVAALLASGHIFINKDRCINLVAELGLYMWDAKKSLLGVEDVVKQNDHSCDALRYGIFTTTTNYEVFGYSSNVVSVDVPYKVT